MIDRPKFLLIALFLTACGGTEIPVEPVEPSCPSGQLMCAGKCADVQTDEANCGACGSVCATGQSCQAGVCTTVCVQGQTECAGLCRELTADPANCGACGNACATGEVCSAGICAVSCSPDLTDCSGSCRDLQTDRSHCGGCGVACASGEVCADGQCEISCPAGQVNCGDGLCRDLSTDSAMCGNSCATAVACSGGRVCEGGVCGTSCPEGQVDCGDGLCRDLSTDSAMCGTSCASAVACSGGRVCQAAECATSCPTGQVDCGDGLCRTLSSDDAMCGTSCASAVACASGTTCAGGSCVPSCQSGLTECGGSCTNTAWDPANCGACGQSCPSGFNALAVCASGSCGMTCASGFGECDADSSTGCETNLQSDLSHCGACGFACPTPANAVPSCTSGTCGITCNTGFGNCDGNDGNGCESNLSQDSANCGACGQACGSTQFCSSGVCLDNIASCQVLKQNNPAAASGVYPLDPDQAGPVPTFNAYCDMTTAGGGWTLLTWTGQSSTAPLGVPYPGLAYCSALNCPRGSGVPAVALPALFNGSQEFAVGQSVTTNLKATYAEIGTYQYAGRYTYASLAGLVPNYGPTTCGTGFATGTFHNVVNATASEGTVIYLAQHFAYAGYDYSSDASSYIWNVGAPGGYCSGNGIVPGSWMGTWSTHQYGPGQSNAAGSYSLWVR